jgi:hypothetical protein
MGPFGAGCASASFARRFRAAVAEADEPAAAAMQQCVEPVLKRARRNAVPRYETLVDAARCWPNLVSSEFRLDLTARKTKRGPTLLLRDVRLVSGSTEADEGDMRKGVSIVLCEMRAEPGVTSFQVTPIASIQMHALARWHQRSFEQTTSALMHDLAALARGYASAVAEAERTHGHEFTVTAGDGRWVGTLVWQHNPAKTGESVMLWARSFLNDDE